MFDEKFHKFEEQSSKDSCEIFGGHIMCRRMILCMIRCMNAFDAGMSARRICPQNGHGCRKNRPDMPVEQAGMPEERTGMSEMSAGVGQKAILMYLSTPSRSFETTAYARFGKSCRI